MRSSIHNWWGQEGSRELGANLLSRQTGEKFSSFQHFFCNGSNSHNSILRNLLLRNTDFYITVLHTQYSGESDCDKRCSPI